MGRWGSRKVRRVTRVEVAPCKNQARARRRCKDVKACPTHTSTATAIDVLGSVGGLEPAVGSRSTSCVEASRPHTASRRDCTSCPSGCQGQTNTHRSYHTRTCCTTSSTNNHTAAHKRQRHSHQIEKELPMFWMCYGVRAVGVALVVPPPEVAAQTQPTGHSTESRVQPQTSGHCPPSTWQTTGATPAAAPARTSSCAAVCCVDLRAPQVWVARRGRFATLEASPRCHVPRRQRDCLATASAGDC